MKKFTHTIIVPLLAAVLFAAIPAKAQFTIIYSENFDADSVNLPAGWSSTGNAWHIETSNVSTGYPGASGFANVAIRNDSATGVYDLVSKSVSTVGYTSINVIWGARLTTNFPGTGSTIQGLYWSSDNGITWNTLTYTENTNNSNWSLDNGSMTVGLPAAAENQASLKFKITASIVTGSQGTYRIDDFTVAGINGVGIAENSNLFFAAAIYPNPSAGATKLLLDLPVRTRVTIDVFDALGRQTGSLANLVVNPGDSGIVLDEKFFAQDGLYFIRIQSGNETRTLQLLKN